MYTYAEHSSTCTVIIGKWEMIESLRGIDEETPSSCTRPVKKYTDGGWLTISRTEGYNLSLIHI